MDQIKNVLNFCAKKGGGRLGAFFLFFSALWLACLCVGALGCTVLFSGITERGFRSEQAQFFPLWETPSFAILTFVVLIIMAAITRYFLKYEDKVKTIPFLIGATVVSALAMAFWVSRLETQCFLFADSYELIGAAKALLAGNYQAFRTTPDWLVREGPHFYFHFYPYQAGTLFYFSFLGFLFGGVSYQLIQYANVVFTALCVPLMYFLTLFAFNRKAAKLASLFTAVCAPLLLSVVLPYGNSAGLFFCFLALTALTYLCRAGSDAPLKHKLIAAAVVLIACTLAMLVKATSNLFVLVVVLVLAGLVISWNKRVIPACLLVLCLLCQGIPNMAGHILEDMTQAQFSQGQPKTAWIALGLRDDNVLERPGWWSMYPWTVFNEVGEDLNAQDQVFKQSIKESLTKFVTQPAYGLSFFAMKLGSEWLDPSFQGIFYTSMASTHPVHTEYEFTNSKLVNRVLDMNLMDSNLLYPYMKAYQLMMLIGAALSSLLLLRAKSWRRECTVMPVVIALLLGSFCYVFWEAKAIYLLPFFICCIPLAAGFFERCNQLGFESLKAAFLNRN